MRPATFIAEADGDMPGPKPCAHVVTPDGQERFPFLHPDVNLEDLACGKTVYLDPKGTVVLGVGRRFPEVGQEATFLRRLPDRDLVEVAIRDEQVLLYAPPEILEAAESGALCAEATS